MSRCLGELLLLRRRSLRACGGVSVLRRAAVLQARFSSLKGVVVAACARCIVSFAARVVLPSNVCLFVTAPPPLAAVPVAGSVFIESDGAQPPPRLKHPMR